MENYESLGTIGEGTYGVVLKCRHKVTGQIVAIKKFKESDDDEQVKKTALREIKILKQLKHENIVSLLEVFRVKGKLYLVFEFVEKTILEEIEKYPEGLDPAAIKRLMWQLVRAIHFCHQHNIIHRDIKPENLLVSRNGVLKLCDFGFARPLAGPGAKYTEYVSTRWYRAPELLVGDVSYGKAVDVWSIGCMFAEIATGLPLFPGDSDIDQLYHIIKCLGRVTPRQQELFRKNSLYVGVKLPHATELESLEARFPHFDKHAMDFLRQTIKEEPLDRWTCAELLNHPFFDNACELFEQELQDAIQRDLNETVSLRKKRVRSQKPPPSRGSGGGGSGSGVPTLSSDEYASFNTEPTPAHVFKPSFKPIVMTGVSKDNTKGGSGTGSTNSNSGTIGNGALQQQPPVPKKPTVIAGGGSNHGNANGSLVLPTLSSMTPSSSSTSTVSVDSNPAQYHQQHQSQQHHQQQSQWKKGASVLPVPSEHAQPRVSLTSHGGRPPPQYQPQPSFNPPFQSFAPSPKPPPTSYGKNAYNSTPPHALAGSSTPTSKQLQPRVFPTSTNAKPSGGNKLHGGGNGNGVASMVSNSLQSSVDIYSPKKAGGGSHGHHSTTSSSSNSSSSSSSSSQHVYPGSKKNGAFAPLPDAAPRYPEPLSGYVPPKTSHGGGSRGGKHRREQDHRTY